MEASRNKIEVRLRPQRQTVEPSSCMQLEKAGRGKMWFNFTRLVSMEMES